MRMLVWLCVMLGGFGNCLPAANAQSGGVYAAPGMPIYPQPQGSAAAKPLAKAFPKAGPLITPRFWKLRDSAYIKAATPFYRYVAKSFQWPSTTMRAGIEGKIFIRLTVLPNGTVGKSEIVGRKLNQADGFPEDKISKDRIKIGHDALDLYAIKFAEALRFEVSTVIDTVTMPVSFRME